MTKFITYYSLFPIPDPKDFLGSVLDRDEGHIITTLGKNIVIVLNVRTQKQVRSWSMVEKLSAKVVYDTASAKYVGVFGQQVLRCWDVDTQDISKCKKLKFQRSIAQLLNDSGGRVLVLYTDGSIEPLHIALQTRKERNQRNEELMPTLEYTINDAHIWKLNSEEQLLTYFKADESSNELSLMCQTLTVEGLPMPGSAPLEFKIHRNNEELKCMGYTVVEGTKAPTLMTIWADKRIFMLPLTPDVKIEASPGNYVSMLTELDVSNPLSMHSISRNFVAIYGAKTGQEGGMLLLYNTQFKVIKAKQYFKIYFSCSRLWSVDEHILLAMGQNLSVVTYRMTKELLSELIGTKCSNDFDTTIDEEFINEEDNLEDPLSFDSEATAAAQQSINKSPSSTSNSKVSDKAKNFIKQNEPKKPEKISIADGKLVPYMPADDFENELSELSHKLLNVELVTVEDSNFTDGPQLELLDNYNDTGCRDLVMQQIITQLERSGASEHELSEKLLTVFLRAERIEDLLMVLGRYTNISEKMIAKVLRYALEQQANIAETLQLAQPMEVDDEAKSNDDKLTNGLSTTATADQPNYNILANDSDFNATQPKPVQLLNAALACSFNADTMTVHLRREISLAHVLQLFEYLYLLLTNETLNGLGPARPSYTPPCIEFELQLCRWFGVLINSHFQQLVMSKDLTLVDLMQKWNELFLLYKQEIFQLEQTNALLNDIMQKRNVAGHKNYAKWYSIEEVDLF